MHRALRIIALALLSILAAIPVDASAQALSTFGTEFYCTVPLSSFRCNTAVMRTATILLAAPTDASVEVYYVVGAELSSAGYVNVRAERTATLSLNIPSTLPKHPSGDTPDTFALKIVSTSPVSAALYTEGLNYVSRTTLIPTPALGTDYVIATLPTNPSQGAGTYYACQPDTGSGYFQIVAPYDSTTVTITPAGTTMGGHVGVYSGPGANGTAHPYSVLLQKGQAYLVKSDITDPEDDLTGSQVSASKPIAVFAGHEDAVNGISSSAASGEDQRNILFQQLVPVRYWGGETYGIPLYDAPGTGDEATLGEKMRIVGKTVKTPDIAIQDARTYNPLIQPYLFGEYTLQAATRILGPVMTMRYDEWHSTTLGVPVSTPTMSSFVPTSGAMKRYIIPVSPKQQDTSGHRAYIDVIARRDRIALTQVWVDGVGPRSIFSLPSVGTAYAIPAHAELIGRRFQIGAGCYDLSEDSAFYVQVYGVDAWDVAHNGLSTHSDDYYGEFAASPGRAFRTETGIVPSMTARRSCSTWTVTATAADSDKIVDIRLLNDSARLYSSFGYQSVNAVVSSRAITPARTASIQLESRDPRKPAILYVQAVTQSGRDTIMRLYTPDRSVSISPVLDRQWAPSRIGVDSCVQTALQNIGSDTVTVTRLIDAPPVCSLQTTRQLPMRLAPGDSLPFTICIRPDTTSNVTVTPVVQMDCDSFRLHLTVVGAKSIVQADDISFGDFQSGTLAQLRMYLSHSGPYPVRIVHAALTGSTNFQLLDTLPQNIPAGGRLLVPLVYTPDREGIDSAVIHWTTDQPAAELAGEKLTSILKARAVISRIDWTQDSLRIGTEDPQPVRVWLKNYGSMRGVLDTVMITGPDAPDFSIAGSALGGPPWKTPEMEGDSMWFDIAFMPYGSSTRDRFATLSARVDSDTVAMYMRGSIGKLTVASQTERIEPTAIVDPSGFLSLTLPENSGSVEAAVSDELGRIVKRIHPKPGQYRFDLRGLATGVYYVRVLTARGASTIRISVVH